MTLTNNSIYSVMYSSECVRRLYVEKPDDSKLIESAINGNVMPTGLDPHSSYMDAKSFHDMQVETSGGIRWSRN